MGWGCAGGDGAGAMDGHCFRGESRHKTFGVGGQVNALVLGRL